MAKTILIVSGACQVLSFVLLLVLFAGDSDDFETIERMNWAEFVNARLDPHVVWCQDFYSDSVCRSMQADVYLGAVYSAGHFRVNTETVPLIVSTYNVSSYNENCMLPGGGDLCDGCQRASDVIITFQTFTLITHIPALILCFIQLMAGPSQLDRMLLIGCNVALFFFGIIMVSTFHDRCFTELPDDLNAVEGPCYIFVAFQIVLGLVVAILQVLLGFTTTTPLPKGSTSSLLSGLKSPLSGSSIALRTSTNRRISSKMQPLVHTESSRNIRAGNDDDDLEGTPAQPAKPPFQKLPTQSAMHKFASKGGGKSSVMKMEVAPAARSDDNPFGKTEDKNKNKSPKAPRKQQSKSNGFDMLADNIKDGL